MGLSGIFNWVSGDSALMKRGITRPYEEYFPGRFFAAGLLFATFVPVALFTLPGLVTLAFAVESLLLPYQISAARAVNEYDSRVAQYKARFGTTPKPQDLGY